MSAKNLSHKKVSRSSSPKIVEAERVLEVLKGPWRMVQFLILSATNFSQSWSMYGNTFMGAEPLHHCQIPEGYSVNESIPMKENDGEIVAEKCLMYKNFSYLTNQTVQCTNGWQYGKELYSFVETWDLVCGRDYLPATVQVVLVAGVACGAFFTTIVADKFGRKTVLLFSMVATTVIGCITATINNFYIFLVLRFLTGAFQQGMVMPQYVMICELFPAKSRVIYVYLSGAFWGIGACIMSLMAYLIPNWRHLLVATSIPSIVGIPLYWVLGESPSWLIAKRKYNAVKQIVKKCNRWNRNQTEDQKNVIEELLTDLSTAEEMWKKSQISPCKENDANSTETNLYETKDMKKTANYSMLDILKSKKLVLYCLIQLFLWITTTLVYYGLTFTAVSWVSSRYLGFFLSSLVEIPGVPLGVFVFQRFGRRWPIISFYILAGGGIFIALAIPKTTASGTDLTAAIIVFSMLAKVGISQTFGGIFLWAPEIYPTTIRNFGLGLASVGGRIGNMCAPLTAYLATSTPILIGVIFGGMSVVSAGLALLLPETHRRPLPLSIAEIESWSRTISNQEMEALKKKPRGNSVSTM